jgi:hypothetical protein
LPAIPGPAPGCSNKQQQCADCVSHRQRVPHLKQLGITHRGVGGHVRQIAQGLHVQEQDSGGRRIHQQLCRPRREPPSAHVPAARQPWRTHDAGVARALATVTLLDLRHAADSAMSWRLNRRGGVLGVRSGPDSCRWQRSRGVPVAGLGDHPDSGQSTPDSRPATSTAGIPQDSHRRAVAVQSHRCARRLRP